MSLTHRVAVDVEPLKWEKVKPGKYVATDADGTRWFLTQFASKDWRIFRDGTEDTIFYYALRDAKLSVEDSRFEDANPVIHARREAARAARRLRRRSR